MLEAGERGRPAILFLHGLGTGARAWQPQLDALAAEFHVLAIYQPGYGNTPGPFSLARAVGGIEAALEQHDLERAHLCGLSLGTMVALEFALGHPSSVSSLTLCGGFARLTEEMRVMQLSMAPAMRETPDEVVRQEMVADNVPEPHRAAALEDLSSMTSGDLAEIMEQVAVFDVYDRLAEIRAPTLVLCGEHDHHNFPFCEELSQGIAGARLEIIPDAGHVANLDNPSAFTAALRAFLDAAAPPLQ